MEFNGIADILVIGTGAAGLTAALEASRRGNSVLLLEKSGIFGGTTRKSAGGIWIPNNRFLRQRNIEDPKKDFLQFTAKASYPEKYDSSLPNFGIDPVAFSLLEAFYDNGTQMLDVMVEENGLKLAGSDAQTGRSNYYPMPEDRVPRGRGIKPLTTSGTLGRGPELITQLESAAKNRKIPIVLNTRARCILRNSSHEVIGIEASQGDPDARVLLGARKAVVFATGGFAHSSELKKQFLPQPILGSCAVPESEGDFIRMVLEIGGALEERAHGWWTEVVLEEAVQGKLSNDVWVPPGDSMVLVNKFGRRVVNEKLPYHLRTPIHFVWDSVQREFPNLLLFMIYDRHTLENFDQETDINYPSLAPNSPYVICRNTLEELGSAIQTRLEELTRKYELPAIQLEANFNTQLTRTILRFNQIALSGKDPEYHRGESQVEIDFLYSQRRRLISNQGNNPTLFPIAETGPYYAIILAGGTLDTHGGPKINERGQLLSAKSQPIPRLYGAGNCVMGPAGDAYWGPGTTLGIAMTCGYIAAVSASDELRRCDFD